MNEQTDAEEKYQPIKFTVESELEAPSYMRFRRWDSDGNLVYDSDDPKFSKSLRA